MAGATVGALGGPVGAAGGALIGGGIALGVELGQGFMGALSNSDFFNNAPPGSVGMGGMAMAEGGFVNQPTRALIGEAGPEAVIPLDRFERMMGISNRQSGNSTEQVINLNFDSITIGAGNAVTASDVREIMERQMPNIIRNSLTRGARGVI